MIVSVNIWDEDLYSFDYTDDTSVLSLSYCKESELPKDEKYFKLLPKVYKKELDVSEFSYYLTKKELDKLL